MMWRIATGALAVAFGIAAALLVGHYRERPPDAPPPVRSNLVPPDDVEFGAADSGFDAAISPDGRTLAFVASSRGRVQLWRRALDSDRAEPLAGTDAAAMPAWKPGGNAISFFADGLLKQIALADGTVRELASAPAPAGASWRADGSLLFVPDSLGPVKAMRAGSVTDATQLKSGDRGHAFPASTPDGGFIYVAVRENGTRTLRHVQGAEERDLTQTSSHATVVDNVVIYVRDGVLLAQRLDPERGDPVGRAAALVSSVGVSAAGHGAFVASPRLVIAAAPRQAGRELFWLDAQGQRGESLLEPGDYSQVRLSPDDRHAAVTALDPLLRTLDVFIVPIASPADRRRLSLSLGPDSDPTWLSDGRRVVFRSVERGTSRMVSRALMPPTAAEEPYAGGNGDTPTDARGNVLLVYAQGAGSGLDVWAIDTARGTRERITTGAFNEWDARLSPDGQWIAYVSDESGRSDVYVAAWPSGGQRVRVSFAGGSRPQWRGDGRSLLFMRQSQIQRATRQDGGRIAFATPETTATVTGLTDFAVAHRSDRIAVLAAVTTAIQSAVVTSDWQSLVAR